MDVSEPTGISRREVLRRGAVVGGAVLAASSLGTISAYAQTSPPPPPPPDDPPDDPPTGSLPSNFQIIVAYGGVNYGVKYDGSWDAFGRGNTCPFQASWAKPDATILAKLAGTVSVGADSTGHLAYILTLPAGFTFVEGRAWDGTCQAYPGAHDKCGAAVQPMGNGTLAFSACD